MLKSSIKNFISLKNSIYPHIYKCNQRNIFPISNPITHAYIPNYGYIFYGEKYANI